MPKTARSHAVLRAIARAGDCGIAAADNTGGNASAGLQPGIAGPGDRQLRVGHLHRFAGKIAAAGDLYLHGCRAAGQPHVARAFLLAVEGTPPEAIVEELGIAKSSVYVYKSRVQKELRAEIVRLNRLLG